RSTSVRLRATSGSRPRSTCHRRSSATRARRGRELRQTHVMEAESGLGTVAIIVAAVVALAVLVAAYVARKGATRAALVGGLLPLALLPGLVGLVSASMK